jgi:hypothetical protein
MLPAELAVRATAALREQGVKVGIEIEWEMQGRKICKKINIFGLYFEFLQKQCRQKIKINTYLDEQNYIGK